MNLRVAMRKARERFFHFRHENIFLRFISEKDFYFYFIIMHAKKGK